MFEYFKLSKRLSEVEDALIDLKRRLTSVEVEWTDTLDRLKRMMGRINKDRQRAEAANPSEPLDTAEGDGTPEAVAGTLTARAREINARILARRNRGAN